MSKPTEIEMRTALIDYLRAVSKNGTTADIAQVTGGDVLSIGYEICENRATMIGRQLSDERGGSVLRAR